MISRRTVSPPTPESKIPMGEEGMVFSAFAPPPDLNPIFSVATFLTKLISEIVIYPLGDGPGQFFLKERRNC